ncbi:MAG: phage tail protein [Dehalococcoidia bacterium]|nr:phage tail protein [Dehalococcoidia bacterium]
MAVKSFRVEIHDAAGNLLAIMENAFGVGYEQAVNLVPKGWFSLPVDDPKASYIQDDREVWIYEDGSLQDVYLITDCTANHSTSSTIKAQCEQFAARLLRDIVPGYYEATNQLASTVLTDLLNYQVTGIKVTLGGIDANLDKLISIRFEWEYLLKACWAVRDLVNGYIYVRPDPQNPAIRKLWIKESIGEDKGQQLRYRKNMTQVERKVDRTALCTRLFPLGMGEAQNQLKLSHWTETDVVATKSSDSSYGYLTLGGQYAAYVWSGAGNVLPSGMIVKKNGADNSSVWKQGSGDNVIRCAIADFDPAASYTITHVHADYLRADTATVYGVISQPWVDKRINHPSTLIERARSILTDIKNPKATYKVNSIDLARLYPGREFERLQLGSKVMVIDEDLGIEQRLQIVKIRKNDLGQPEDITLDITNITQNLGDFLSKLASKQAVSDQYADGYTNLTPFLETASCDPTHPYEHEFYLHPQAVRINAVLLTWKVLAFWAYAKAAASGGGGYVSSDAGGGTFTSTYSGGGSATTSSGGGSHAHAIPAEGIADAPTDWIYLGRSDLGSLAIVGSPSSGNAVWTSTAVEHTHTVYIPDHTHLVYVPNHTHSFTVPAHSHDLTFGIYQGPTATGVDIEVDGTVIATGETYQTDVDITRHLAVDGGGNIQRGWHTVKFTPNDLTRIRVDVIVQQFISGRSLT